MSLCAHFIPGCYPIAVDLVLDDHLGYTEALVSCTECERSYLLEMVDWENDCRLFWISEPNEQATRLLLRDLARGSCDINRAGEEVRQFSLIAERMSELLLIDSSARVILGRVRADSLPPEIPSASWRELSCDGSLVRQIQDERL